MKRWWARIIVIAIYLLFLNSVFIGMTAFFLRVDGGRTEIYSWSLHEIDVNETPGEWNNWHPRLTHTEANAERSRVNVAYIAELWDDDSILFLLQFTLIAILASCIVARSRVGALRFRVV